MEGVELTSSGVPSQQVGADSGQAPRRGGRDENGIPLSKHKRVRRSRAQMHADRANNEQRLQGKGNDNDPVVRVSHGQAMPIGKTIHDLVAEQKAFNDCKQARKLAKQARRREDREAKNNDEHKEKDLANITKKKKKTRVRIKRAFKTDPHIYKGQPMDRAARHIAAEAARAEKQNVMHQARIAKGLPCHSQGPRCLCFKICKAKARSGNAQEGQVMKDLGFKFEVTVVPLIGMLHKMEVS